MSLCICDQQDLYKPETPRLRRNLSALINFAKFREEKLGPYSEMQECVGELLVEQQELQDVRAQLVWPLPTSYATLSGQVSVVYSKQDSSADSCQVRELEAAKLEWNSGVSVRDLKGSLELTAKC